MILRRIFQLALATTYLLLISCKETGKQENSFVAFLSELQEVKTPDISTFGSYESKGINDKFAAFLPAGEDDSPCKGSEWKNGGYMLQEDIVVAFMSRICWNYHDVFDKYLMENTGRDLIMITYSAEGKIIDHKVVAHEGEAYRTTMTYDADNESLIVEHGYLTDGSQLRGYDNKTFNMERHAFSVDKNGNISDTPVGKPWEETVTGAKDKADRHAFDNFLIRFEKWKEPEVDNAVFDNNSNNDNTLSSQDIYTITSDTLDCDCFQKDLMWQAGHFVATEKSYYFFVVKCCEYPKDSDSDRYIDYLILEFDKSGTFVKNHEIIRLPYDPSQEEQETGVARLQETLQRKWKEISAAE